MSSDWISGTCPDEKVFINLAAATWMRKLSSGFTRVGFGQPDNYIDVKEAPEDLLSRRTVIEKS